MRGTAITPSPPETTITDDKMALMELVEKTDDVDLVRELLAYGAQRLMAAEVERLAPVELALEVGQPGQRELHFQH